MTNEELIHDLKQFIEATVTQQTATINQRMDRFEQQLTLTATKEDIKAVERRLDTIQDAIADTLTQVTEDLDHRVTRLEQQAA